MNVRPLQDRVVVQRVEEEVTTKGGIIIPDTAKEKPQQGKIVAVGKGKLLENGTRVELDLKPGTRSSSANTPAPRLNSKAKNT